MRRKNFIYHHLVNKNNLIKFLNPATKGTFYWQSKPSSNLSNAQIGRVILQFHQIVSILKLLKINLKEKNFLDIGTGNGMIPKLISKYTQIKYTHGIDPFLDGEHATSWQKHNSESEFKRIMKEIDYIISRSSNKSLNLIHYNNLLKQETFSLNPEPIQLEKRKKIKYKFYKIDALKVDGLKKKYDIIYLKALEHISQLDQLFLKLKKITKKGSILYFKHRSFFSYLGAHRYSSTYIPWGHVFLNDKEMISYVKFYHKDRYKEFIRFYFNDLSYPRFTVNELIQLATKYNFVMKINITEPFKKLPEALDKIKNNKLFWKKINKNYPSLSSSELFSGMYHIIMERI